MNFIRRLCLQDAKIRENMIQSKMLKWFADVSTFYLTTKIFEKCFWIRNSVQYVIIIEQATEFYWKRNTIDSRPLSLTTSFNKQPHYLKLWTEWIPCNSVSKFLAYLSLSKLYKMHIIGWDEQINFTSSTGFLQSCFLKFKQSAVYVKGNLQSQIHEYL